MSWRTHYGYDRFGNRYQDNTLTQNTGLNYVNVTSTDINRTTNRFASGITYDSGGNVLTDNKFKPNFSFAYDANNHVVSTNNGAITAVYDASGQRVCATVAAVDTTSVYDATGQLIAEYNGATLIREYIGNLATVEGATVRYLTSNHLGSNSVVMNDTGGVVARHDYLPFGEEVAANMGMRSTGQGYGAVDLTRTKFAGMERESANGLDHTMFRKAETKAGRWNSPDPYTGSMRVTNPQSLNRYQYVLSDPINLVDPLGLYEGCTHGAMAEFIGNLSGNLTSKQAKDLGNYASDLPGGADSFKYAATNPLNFLKAFIYEGGPSANIHFATELQIFVGKTIFQSLIGSGEDFSVQQAGFIIHSIQDMHGPHGDFGLRRGFGHTMGGTAVNKVLGDTKFDNVSNELLRLFSNDQSRSLSQVDKFKLLRAINNRCNPPKPIPVASSGNVGGINPHPFIGIPNISYGSNVSPWRFPIPPTPIGVGSYPNFITVPG